MRRGSGWRTCILGASVLALTACSTRTGTHSQAAAPKGAVSPGLQALVAALEGRRLLEPRLTGGFAGAPCRQDNPPRDLIPEPRCSDLPQHGTPPYLALVRATHQIRKETRENPSPATLHAQALSLLVWNQADGAIDQAIRGLTEASRQDPTNPRLLSDLAAAHYLRAQRQDEPLDLVIALAYADRALAQEPNLLEARFNRALILQRLFLLSDARSAWEDYLREETSPDWREEGSAHQRAVARDLEVSSGARTSLPPLSTLLSTAPDRQADLRALARIAAADPQKVRERLELELFPSWAEAELSDRRKEAEAALERAESLAAALQEISDDALPRESVEAIRRAASSPAAASRLRALAQGHLRYRAGKARYDQLQVEEAIRDFRQAEGLLRTGRSPFAAWASYYLAVCRYWQGDLGHALAHLRQLRTRHAGQAHPNLRAHIDWMEGLIHAARARLGDSLSHYQKALAAFDETGERTNGVRMRLLLANNFALLGNHREAWKHLYRALRKNREIDHTRWRLAVLDEAATSCRLLGYADLCPYFDKEAIEVALAVSNPTLVAEAYVSRAKSRYRLNQATLAITDLQEARRWTGEIDDPSLRRMVEAKLLVAEGQILHQGEPEAALAKLHQAIDYYDRTETDVLLINLYVQRAQVYLTKGHLDLAESDLLAAIEALERHRRDLMDAGIDDAFFEEARRAFMEMIRFQLRERGRPERAYEFAERALANEFLIRPAIGGVAGQDGVPSYAAIQRALPAHVALVQYAVLPDGLVTWVFTRQRTEVQETSVSEGQIRSLKERLLQAIHHRALEEVPTASAPLYDLLIRPVVSSLAGVQTLVVVPDRLLHGVPFSALVDPNTGRYLIQDYAVALAPRATLLLRWLPLPGPTPYRRPATALLVGNPDFSVTQFPHLHPLAGAEAEARSLANLYPDATMLLGRTATKGEFLRLAGHHEVVHFAGHAVVNHHVPMLSFLLFAPAAPGDGGDILTAREILDHSFPGTRLVVLAACGTAASHPAQQGGALGIAGPVLATGVPAVVASLWPVDDGESSALLQIFHRRLIAGDAPVTALRQAQLSFLGDSGDADRSFHTWAAYAVFGGL